MNNQLMLEIGKDFQEMNTKSMLPDAYSIFFLFNIFKYTEETQ